MALQNSVSQYRARETATIRDSAAAAITVLHRVFKAFQYRDFRLMWIGACTSSIGSWMQNLAQSWLIYTLTDSQVSPRAGPGPNGLPIFLFSLFGGVLADRIERRHVLLGSQFMQMSCASS